MTDIEKLNSYKLAKAIHLLTQANEALEWTHEAIGSSRLQDLAEEVRKTSVMAIQIYCDLIERSE